VRATDQPKVDTDVARRPITAMIAM
jgi:hypothetical protein